MIQAFARDFWKWITDTAWPATTGAYAAHEGVRQVVTFAVGLFVGWALL